MVERFSNRARGTLAAGIGAGDLSLTLDTGQGALFPALSVGDYFWGVLEEGSLYAPSKREVVQATVRSGDVVTIVRGQQGTAAQSFALGSRFENRITRTGIELIRDRVTEPSHIARFLPPMGFLGSRAGSGDPWGCFGVTIPGGATLATTSQVDGQHRAHFNSGSTTRHDGTRGFASDGSARGNVSGRGGFRCEGKIYVNNHVTNTRVFIGYAASPTQLLVETTDPGSATTIPLFGFGWDNASLATGNLFLFHGAGTGSVTAVDTGIAKNSMLTNLVYLLIKADANASFIRAIARDLVTGTGIDQNISTNLPPATTFMQFQFSLRGNGVANDIRMGASHFVGRSIPW
jgi:hypothetical protein